MCNTIHLCVHLLVLASPLWCGYLGAGEGMGSCAASPFRAAAVYWAQGCPPHAPCCSEFGYCRPRVRAVQCCSAAVLQ